ncbi:hypothetical protein GCM10028774_49660 [Spirosoma jeollabukense]
MVMLPEAQEKRELNALINKEDFSVGLLLVNNVTYPILSKQKKIQPEVNDIPSQATIETNDLYGWKRGIKSFK